MKLRPGKWLDRNGTVWTICSRKEPTEGLKRQSSVSAKDFVGRCDNITGWNDWYAGGNYSKSYGASKWDLIKRVSSDGLLTMRRTNEA